MLWWIVGLWLAPAVLALLSYLFVMLRGKRPPKAGSADASTATPLREYRISRYVWGSQEPSPPGLRPLRAVTRQRSIRPMVTCTGTDLQPELTEFVRALRRRAARMRQRAPHGKPPKRSPRLRRLSGRPS